MAADLAGKASREVRALHEFFVGWFRGDLTDFAPCAAAFAADFRMITPDGAAHDRAAVMQRLIGARASAPADFAIDILQPHVAWQSADAVLLEYVERQYRDGRIGERKSTGLFTDEIAAPRGVVWRHLQETWMTQDADKSIQMRTATVPRREA
jgi:hypothetical protein